MELTNEKRPTMITIKYQLLMATGGSLNWLYVGCSSKAFLKYLITYLASPVIQQFCYEVELYF